MRVDQVSGCREVRVDGLSRDQQVHDLGRALEDPVDPEVAEHLLGGDRAFAAGRERRCGLESPAAADLHELVADAPGHLRGPHLGERGLDANVLAVLVGEHAREVDDRLERERRRGDERDLVCDRGVLADGPAPLHTCPRPLARDLQAPLGCTGADGGDRQPAGVEGGQARS